MDDLLFFDLVWLTPPTRNRLLLLLLLLVVVVGLLPLLFVLDCSTGHHDGNKK
jgi:hypothetical protein